MIFGEARRRHNAGLRRAQGELEERVTERTQELNVATKVSGSFGAGPSNAR